MASIISSQEKILHLLIHYKILLDEFASLSPSPIEQFDAKYNTLLKGLMYAHSLSVSLTRDSYKEYVKKITEGKKQNAIAEDTIFVQIADLIVADPNDYPMLLEDIRIGYIKECSASFFESFQKTKDKDFVKSLKELSGKIEKVTSETSKNKFQAYNIKDYFKEWFSGLIEKRNNPTKRLLTGIKEIDESMQTGLIEGGLTLFVAEPGGMKCVPGFALVNCEDGSKMKVSQLVHLASNGFQLPKIQSAKNDYTLYYQNIQAIGPNGVKKCYKVTTADGFSVVATGNHPILTPRGYVNIDDLKSGDFVAVVRDDLRHIGNSDIYWDKISDISYDGEHETYDISMPVDHNFVCNNIVTHNTMMMMNIALNVFMDYGEPVLLVTLEMTRDMMMNRIISRETGIDLKKITNPDTSILTEDDLIKIKKAEEKWAPKMNDFVILDNLDRMTFGDIKRFVEKNNVIYNFRLVVIDYIAILQPEERYQRQSEYSWAGEICKDARQLGRKFGFHTISAVQLGKESLKKLKSQKPGKQSAGVEDMRGSHDYSADADNVYIQWPHPNEPTQKLCVVCGKARNGKKTFINDAITAVLEIKPHLQRICTDNVAKWKTDLNDPIHKLSATAPKIDDLDGLDDLANEPPKPKVKKKIDHTNLAFLD